ncbi:S-layer homology domain-containing protein [Paenibacillus sp. GCM10027627]|uniref:S-layer homology domain-containing protein n=1 Tax=unclassified Paenibacillus TaxID=185978 RepID=UPI003633EC61
MLSFKGRTLKTISCTLIAAMVVSLFGAALASANEEGAASSIAASGLKPGHQKGILSGQLATDSDVTQFLNGKQSKFGISSSSHQLFIQDKSVDSFGGTHYLYQLEQNGIPVYGKYARVHLDPNRRISEIQNESSSDNLPPLLTSTTPVKSAEDAIQALRSALEGELGAAIPEDQSINGLSLPTQPEASLIIYPYKGISYLAYEVKLSYLTPKPGKWVAYIDAHSGGVIDKYSILEHAQTPADINADGKGANDAVVVRPLKVTYEDIDDQTVTDNVYILEDRSRSMYNAATDSGVVRTFDYSKSDLLEQADKVHESAVNEISSNTVNAHYYAGYMYEYFKTNFNRNSINDFGMDLQSVANYYEEPGTPYNNAFWFNGLMVYGNGQCYSCALDVIAHEFTHGVTESTSALEYRHQSGALNESFSDIFGVLAEMEYKNEVSWLLGEDSGEVIRDMASPALYRQPDHMNTYKYLPNTGSGDYGGVHYNSGIQNKAAYLIATKLDSLGLDGKQILGDLSYDVLVNRLMPVSDFEHARDAFVSSAEDYVDYELNDPRIIDAVVEAWTEVGLPPGQYYDLTGIIVEQVDEFVSAWVDLASNSLFLNVPEDTNLADLFPEVFASDGATVELKNRTIDGNEWQGTYEVSAQGTKVKWTVTIGKTLPLIAYEGSGFTEKAANNGELEGEITLRYLASDIFYGEIGEDFIQTGKLFAGPLPEGIEAQAILTTTNEIKLTLTGQALSHSHTDSTDGFIIWFNEYAFLDYLNKYKVADSFKALSGIDFIYGLKKVSSTADSAVLEWPAARGASTIELLQSSDLGQSWSPAQTAGAVLPTSTTATVQGLEANKQYQFKLVITGGDDEGESERLTLNRAPLGKLTLSDQSATVGGSSLSIAAANAFSDPDAGDTLKYAVNSSRTDVATASLANGTITVAPLSVGESTISYTATDSQGESTTLSFKVTVTSPSVVIGGVYIPTGPVKSNNGKINIPVGQAGEVSLGSDVSVSVPEGASNQPLTVTIEKVADKSQLQANGIVFASEVYELLKNIAGNFGKEVTITLKFDPELVKKGQRPAIFYYDEVKKIWVELTGSVVKDNFISAKVNHFTKFAVLAVDVLPEPAKFADIESHWAKANIEKAVQLGIVNGYDDGTFKPNGSVTRQEFIVMLMKTLKSDVKGDALHFADVEEIEDWAKDAIAQAVKLGFVEGYSDGTFQPNRPITRAEMAAILADALKLEKVDGAEAGFADEELIPAWARDAVAALKKAGIIHGKAGNRFAPHAGAERSEAVTLLLKVLEKQTKA